MGNSRLFSVKSLTRSVADMMINFNGTRPGVVATCWLRYGRARESNPGRRGASQHTTASEQLWPGSPLVAPRQCRGKDAPISTSVFMLRSWASSSTMAEYLLAATVGQPQPRMGPKRSCWGCMWLRRHAGSKPCTLLLTCEGGDLLGFHASGFHLS